MGKSDENQTKKRVLNKDTDGESKHKCIDGECKHKKQSSFDTLAGNVPLATTFTDTDAALRRHSQWQDFFRQLWQYKVQFGNCIVPQQYSANPKLGRWVLSQRNRYRKNKEQKSTSMAAERIRALDSIGFDWGIGKTDWSVRFEQLREFKVQFGHCLVPIRYSSNPELGRWVAKQRNYYRAYQEGKPNPMTTDRIRELESVEFTWKRSSERQPILSRWLREIVPQSSKYS